MLGPSKIEESLDDVRSRLPKMLRLNLISKEYFDQAQPKVLELLSLTKSEMERQSVSASNG